MKANILLALLFLGLDNTAQAKFLPSTEKLIDQTFGAGSAARAQPGQKTLRMKFSKEELWDLRKIRNVCEASYKTCPKKEQSYQQRLIWQCAKEKGSCRNEKTKTQIFEMCEAHKIYCLKNRTETAAKRRINLPEGVPLTRITIDVKAKVKILFLDAENKKKHFAQARIVVIFENLSKKYDTSSPSHQISSKLIMDGKLFDLTYVSLRLPAIKLCDQPLNLVTVLLQTKRGLFHTSRAFFIPANCHYDFE